MKNKNCLLDKLCILFFIQKVSRVEKPDPRKAEPYPETVPRFYIIQF